METDKLTIMITTFEQAKRLRDLGYFPSGGYNHVYKNEGGILIHGSNELMCGTLKEYPAPSVSDALQWIRDNKGIECGVYPVLAIHLDYRKIIYIWEYFGNEKEPPYTYKKASITKLYSFPLAESALLDEVLTYLEKKK